MTTYETELAAGPLGNLQGAVSEHSRWLELNCSSQLEYYTRFVNDRQRQGSGMSVASSSSSSSTGSSASPAASSALAVVGEFSPAAVTALLSEQMREAVVSTAGLAVGKLEQRLAQMMG